MVNEEGIPWTGILREWTEGVVIAHTEEPVPIFWVESRCFGASQFNLANSCLPDRRSPLVRYVGQRCFQLNRILV